MAETFQRFSGPTDEQSALLRLIAERQFPARMGGFYDVLQQFTQRANASPQALAALTSPQLQQMAQALMAAQRGLSTQLGPWGGAQIPAAMGQVMGAQPWLSTFLNPVMAGQGNLQKFLGGTSLIMPGGQVSTSTQTQPTDPTDWMKALQGLTYLGGSVYGAWPRGGGGGAQGLGALGGGGGFT
jgi:hypothetical protein